MFSRQCTFPKSDNLGKNFVGGKAGQKMDMVRHDHGKMTEPALLIVIKANGFENICSDCRMAKMVLMARFCTKGDEIIGVWRDPARRFVTEMFSRGHGFKGTAARDSGGYH